VARPSLNLGTARALVGRHLTDYCRVSRDAGGIGDDVLDTNTLQLVPPAPDSVAVWEGPCLIRPQAVGTTVEGARVMQRGGYHARLPHDAPRLLKGDLLVVVDSADPELTGRELVVIEHAQGATMDVSTNVLLEDIEVAGPQ
jgi:hypothetical protein